MIYFVKHTDYVKIGYTDDICTRLSDLQISCPVKLNLLALIDGGLDDEKSYHEKFKDIHSNGEWFKYTKELEEFVKSLDKILLWKYGFDHIDTFPIGEIKRCRLERNMSMEELGNLIGVTKQGIFDMEKREIEGRISICVLKNVLKAMGYEYAYRAISQ